MIKDMFDKQILELKKLWGNKRQLLFQMLNLAMIVFSALMIWKGLMFMTKVRKSGVRDPETTRVRPNAVLVL
jgi:zona occludens toxin (predicted ATPase)